jgi:hypothetical protein
MVVPGLSEGTNPRAFSPTTCHWFSRSSGPSARGCSRSSALTLFPCQRALRGSALYCRALQFADEGRLERAQSPAVGIETGGCAPTGLRLRWCPARSQFVINVLVRGHNLGRSHRYRTYRWVRVSVMPSFAGRSPCRESPERQRRRRNQRSPGVGSTDSRGEVVRARRSCACWTPGTWQPEPVS